MDPMTLLPAVKLLMDIKKTIDTATLTRTVSEINTKVDVIGRHLTQSAIADLNAGFSHLETALAVTDAELRNDELVAARQLFNRLAQRPARDPLIDTFSDTSAAHLTGLAELGNLYYFILRGAAQRALVSAYACTETFPALGVQVLPVALFDQDWRPLVTSANSDPHRVMVGYRDAITRHRQDRRAYGLDLLWRVPAAAGVALAGLLGATVSPPLAGRGAQWAISILATSEKGLSPPTAPDQARYLALATRLQHQLEPVIADAHRRRVAAEKLSA